ncbi:NUDIX domain-containing protein [Paenibacillus antri]|uniref:NUDIX domain-containing protein n=1 Tax=Paenibacillus antri TaxID=2582848 RepID=A0A5R9GD12_9BACL|nr:NUDIX domain-containing protein [Paenibacillus antri]TLS52206.1 NUDIX domain-containing protein [Paenibacillus antri]
MSHIRVRPTALIIKDNSILLIEYEDNGVHYNLPGGGAEPGETIIDAVKREAFEEACIDIDVGPLALIYEFAPHKQSGDYEVNGKHSLHLIFECTLKDGSIPQLPQVPDPHQSAVKWIPLEQLDSVLLIPNIKDQLKAYIDKRMNVELIEDFKLKPLDKNKM